MKYFIFLYFCCLILAVHSKNKDEVNEEKTPFENLPIDAVQEIMGHLKEKDQQQLSFTSKEFLKYDTREVFLQIPLLKSKKPSQFVCDHLKMRKKLFIDVKYDVDANSLLEPDSLEMKYLKCLSNIEILRLGEENFAPKALSNPNFNLQELFPKLRHLEFNLDSKIPQNVIPNTLKSLKLKIDGFYMRSAEMIAFIAQIDQLETLSLDILDHLHMIFSPLSPMISMLNDMPKFKRLSIKFKGLFDGINDIISQTKDAKYFFDLESDTAQFFSVAPFIKSLPEKTETLDLKIRDWFINEPICSAISTMNHLKKLILHPDIDRGNSDCLLRFLPRSLIELKYHGNILHNIDEIVLPRNLYSVSLGYIEAKVFELLANNVQVLEADILDRENFLMIKEPFTRVKTLIIKNSVMELICWIHLLDLLPMEMDLVVIHAHLYEDYILEVKILTMGKRIKTLELYSDFELKRFYRKYIYDGSKMIPLKERKHLMNAIFDSLKRFISH